MSSAVFNIIAKRALKDLKDRDINSKVWPNATAGTRNREARLRLTLWKDPYFEEVTVYDRHGRSTGKMKKQKKGVPAGLSKNDASVLQKVRRRAYRLDMSLFNFCGIRFGWSSLIAIIPV